MLSISISTYLIRRALKNDSDPCNECLKRSHERQVMKVFVQRVIRSCFANNLVLLRKCTMVPWYHGTMVPRYHGITVPWYHGTMIPWYHSTKVPWYHGTMVPWYHGIMVSEASPVFSTSAWLYVIRGALVLCYDSLPFWGCLVKEVTPLISPRW